MRSKIERSYTCARADVPYYDLCKTNSSWVLQQNIETLHDTSSATWNMKNGVHVRTCTCTTQVARIESIASWSPTTHQVSAECVQPFPGYEKGVRSGVIQKQLFLLSLSFPTAFPMCFYLLNNQVFPLFSKSALKSPLADFVGMLWRIFDF